jgi:hypothetical protein
VSDSSRDSVAGAGWRCSQMGSYPELLKEVSAPKFSWLRPSVLWRTRNDKVAFKIEDPTDEQRKRWITERCAAGRERDFTMSHYADRDEVSFLLMGDTGEGDVSQYVTIAPLYACSEGIEFTVIASDVNYPIGNVNEYLDKFYRPYKDLPGPIYAIPGNHDWYDNLSGFMLALCCAEPLDPAPGPPAKLASRTWLRERLWRQPDPADESVRQRCLAFRDEPGEGERQPGPYWALDAGPVRLVGIDTGILGGIDDDQGAWLRRVSAGPKPKILITGKPIYVDNDYKPCAITGGGWVDEIVRDPETNYIAAIGGDTHNYQRYGVEVGGRRIQYIVSGGGGAYMHATHRIPTVDLPGSWTGPPGAPEPGRVTEDDFRCYPLRGDSLAFYSREYSERLKLGDKLAIPPNMASHMIAERFGMTPTRAEAADVQVTRRARELYRALRFSHLPVGRIYQRFFSEFSDWDDPPLFKSFLRLDMTRESVRIRCFAATGCREHEQSPPVEDDFSWTPAGGWVSALS